MAAATNLQQGNVFVLDARTVVVEKVVEVERFRKTESGSVRERIHEMVELTIRRDPQHRQREAVREVVVWIVGGRSSRKTVVRLGFLQRVSLGFQQVSRLDSPP